MTVSTTNNRIDYDGDGTTTAFSYPYYFQADADLVVILRDSNGTETNQTITTDYSISGTKTNEVYASGGTVTMVSAPSATEELIIYSNPAIKQETDLVENDPLPAETLEQGYDLLTVICQRLADRLDRSVNLSEGYTDTFDTSLPTTLTASATLRVNDTGDGLAMGPTTTEIEAAATEAANAAASAAAAASSASAASTSETNAANSAADAANEVLEAVATETISASGNISHSARARQYRRVVGDGGAVTTANTPFGANPANFTDGMQIRLVGTDSTNTVSIPQNDAQYGVVGPFLSAGESIVLAEHFTCDLTYDATAERFIITSVNH